MYNLFFFPCKHFPDIPAVCTLQHAWQQSKQGAKVLNRATSSIIRIIIIMIIALSSSR